jgi:hypothetical protein
MSPDQYRELFAALDATVASMNEATEAMGRTGQSLRKVTSAALASLQDHEDLRETVARLEALVLELVRRQNGGGERAS